MFRCLIAVVGFGLITLLNLYLFSYNTLLYSSLALKSNLFPTKEKEIIIYGATRYYYKPFWPEDTISTICSEEVAEYCQFTTNPNRSKEAKAWVYHTRDFQAKMMDNRTSDAVHVMITDESPSHETIRFPPNTVNWTMTYKRDSDIFVPYGIFAKNDSVKDLDFIWNMKSPNHTTSWMASHCKTANAREKLILKARDSGLQIDIYGKCYNGSQIPECPKASKDWEFCAGAALQKYFFYFSFENSVCVDYVTEKVYNSWRFYFAVPIVIKREICTDLGFPPKSFIALDDFDSIQDMANFLNVLKTNKTEYLSYHEWRKNYEVKVTPLKTGLCTLCQMLKDSPLHKNNYPDLKKWHSEKTNCDNGYGNKYLK